MYHYEYVSKKEAEPYKKEFEEIIHEVQNLLRDRFTFSYDFIGSYSRNMITFDPRTNKGFDIDVNLHINDFDQEYSPKEIKQYIMNAINSVAVRKGFSYCEDSTRVITLKRHRLFSDGIEYSCDFAIVNDYTDENGEKRQQYIRFQKDQGSYVWADQPKGYDLEERVKWIKRQKRLWSKVRDIYLDKKNKNTDPDKKSRALFAETVNEVCQKYGYLHS